MKSIVCTEYGPPEVLRLSDVEMPVPKKHEVLVRVRAAALNPLDWHLMRGEPYFMRLIGLGAKRRVPGLDVSGEVHEVGAKVIGFRPGDEVFGSGVGSCAEYVCSRQDRLVPKPAALSWEQAAAIPVAGCTALQALRDHGGLRPGQRVMVVGAAGGVGTFAVQIARALGADVTGVCSTRNVDLVRALGAQHVIDYTVEDFTANGKPYDLVLQIAGNSSLSDIRRVLAPNGTLVIVGGGTGRDENGGSGMMAVVAHTVRGRLFKRFVRQRVFMFLASIRRKDLLFLTESIEDGKMRPIIDRTYPLADVAEAIRYLEMGHARGKVVVTI